MGLPESVTYLLLVVLGYALTRVVDLACAWQKQKFTGPGTDGPAPGLSATARQRLVERHSAYSRFRQSVNGAVEAAVNQGHGSYGALYQIRDDYGDLLRQAPVAVTQAADSMIRCVTLLVNLGPSDQRYAMFTRALKHFDEACGDDQGLKPVPPGPRRQEFAVIGSATEAQAHGTNKPSSRIRHLRYPLSALTALLPVLQEQVRKALPGHRAREPDRVQALQGCQ